MNIKLKIKDNKKIIIPPIITTIIILMIYMIKKIYPFGAETIAHTDLAQIYITNFSYYINAMKNLRFSDFFYTDLVYGGNNIYSTGILSGFFSPFSILYLFCNNTDTLVYYMSYILIFKVALSSITAYISFKKIFIKNKDNLNIIFSISYALSAYTLINYTTISWIDIVILFPILAFGLKNIFDNKKIYMYTIALLFIIITNFQLAYMILFSILTVSPFVLKMYVKKENIKECILKLGIGTLLSIIISSMVLLPVLIIYFNSDRVNFSESIYYIKYVFITKSAYLLLSSISLFALIKSIKYLKKDNNIKLLIILFFLLGIIPCVFEGVNRLWHGGSYDSFPFRFGFIPIYVLILLSYYYFNNYYIVERKTKCRSYSAFLYIFFILLFIITIAFEISMAVIINQSGPAFHFNTKAYVLLILIIIDKIMIYYYFLYDNRINYNIIIMIILIMELSIYSYGYIGVPKDKRGGLDHTDTTIFIGTELKNKFEDYIINNGFKYKLQEDFLLENAGLYSRIPFNSAWILNSNSQINLHKQLGYNDIDMKLRSSNGTILSDYLMATKYIFSYNSKNGDIYNLIAKKDNDIYLYEYNIFNNLATVYNSANNIEEFPKNNSKIENQNWIFKNIFNKNIDIITKVDFDNYQNLEIKDGRFYLKNIDELGYVEYNINIIGKKNLYYYFNSLEEYMGIIGIEITTNNKTYEMEDLYIIDSFIDLGYFENEQINVKIYIANYALADSIRLLIFDVDEFEGAINNLPNIKYNEENNKIKYNVISANNSKLLIPKSYDKNWVITNNNKQISYKKALDGFITIDLKEGENNIVLEYKNKQIDVSGIISIIGIIILILITVFQEFIFTNKFIQNIAYILFVIVEIMFFMIVYAGGIILTFFI